MGRVGTNGHRRRTLLILFAIGALAIGLLALVGVKPVWAASRTFEPAPGSPLAVGSTPTTVTNADFNADGKMDLAAQNSGSTTVSVRMGNGDGTFQAKPDVTVGSSPTAVTSADLNDDGKMDLAVANYSSSTVSVLRGNGDGTFQTKQDFAVGSGPSSVIGEDFNGDGYVDLAVANYSSDNVSVLLGQDSNGDGKADGTFRAASNFSIDLPCGGTCIPATANPNQVITADFNGDTRPDLATANVGNCFFFCTPGGVSVLLGNGNGTFQDAKLALSNVTIYSIDANSSGDIMAAKYDSNAVSVLRSNGNGTFSTGPQLPVGSNPSAVTSADLDGDTRADLAVSNFNSDNVSVLFNDGSGGFQSAQNFPAGDGPAFVIGARLNADTFADLAVANQNSNNVSVLLNTVPAPETTITMFPPDPDNGTTATFEFSSSEPNSTFQCALDDPTAYSPCTSPTTVPEAGLLDDGSHTFYVKATGGASNKTDPTADTYTWTVDTVAPATPTITSPQEGSLVSGNFLVSGTADAGSNIELFEGSVSRGTALANTSGEWSIALTSVSDGSHAYKAKATDEASNTSAESNVRTVTVDATPPGTTITSGPSGYMKSTSASFSVSSSEEGSTFKCSRDGSSFADCPTPTGYSGLAQGSHTFRVKAIDEVGNTDTTPASRTWFVDAVVPSGTISINGGNASTSSRSVTLKLSASDPSPDSGVASMRFRNGGTTTWSGWSAYATSKSWTLTAGAGTKTVYVQYRDRARNISAAASDTIKFNP